MNSTRAAEMNALHAALPAGGTPPRTGSPLAGLLDAAPEEACEAIGRQLLTICDVPLVMISLVDEDRVWFKRAAGELALVTPAEVALCTHTLLGAQLTEVPDTCADLRFAGHPLVAGEPKVRYFAGVPLIDASGHALGALCIIDHRRRKLNDLQRDAMRDLAALATSLLEHRRIATEANQLGYALSQAFDEILVIAPGEDRIVHASVAALKHLGFERRELPELRLSAVLSGYPLQALSRLGSEESPRPTMSFEADHVCRDGSTYPVEVRASVTPGTPPGRVIVLANDISSRRDARPDQCELATRDFVTRLANRQTLETQLQRSILQNRRSGVPFAMLMIEIDRLQEIRSGYGQSVAYTALADFSARLRKCAAAQDLVAHLGGDEFAVVTAPVSDSHMVADLATAIQASLDQPFQWEGSHFVLGAHIGAVYCTGDDETVEDFIERGYDAVNLAVLSGTSQYVPVATGKTRLRQPAIPDQRPLLIR